MIWSLLCSYLYVPFPYSYFLNVFLMFYAVCSSFGASNAIVRHLDYFKFYGRVMGLALLYDMQIGVCLDNVMFVQLVRHDVQLEDIKDTEQTLYKRFQDILSMYADFVNLDALGLTFSFEYKELGQTKVVELLRGGANVLLKKCHRSNENGYYSFRPQSMYLPPGILRDIQWLKNSQSRRCQYRVSGDVINCPSLVHVTIRSYFLSTGHMSNATNAPSPLDNMPPLSAELHLEERNNVD